jgi:hypothetical protein
MSVMRSWWPAMFVGGVVVVGCNGGSGGSTGGGAASPGTGGNTGTATSTMAKSKCPHSPPITVTIALVQTGPKTIVDPNPVQTVCPGDFVQWTLESKCESMSKDGEDCKPKSVRVDDREYKSAECKSGSPTSSPSPQLEPFKPKGNDKCRPKHPGAVASAAATAFGEACEVKADAINGCYKYWLKDKFNIDPEIEVQGGDRDLDPLGNPIPSTSPTPTVTPSP